MGTPWVASCTVTVDADCVETCSGPEAADALAYAAFGDHGTREFFTHVRFHKHEEDQIVVHLLVELYARSAEEATGVLEEAARGAADAHLAGRGVAPARLHRRRAPALAVARGFSRSRSCPKQLARESGSRSGGRAAGTRERPSPWPTWEGGRPIASEPEDLSTLHRQPRSRDSRSDTGAGTMSALERLPDGRRPGSEACRTPTSRSRGARRRGLRRAVLPAAAAARRRHDPEWLGSDPGRCGWSPARPRAAAGLERAARALDSPPPHRIVKLQVTAATWHALQDASLSPSRAWLAANVAHRCARSRRSTCC